MYINVEHYYGVADVCHISKDDVKDAVWHMSCSLVL